MTELIFLMTGQYKVWPVTMTDVGTIVILSCAMQHIIVALLYLFRKLVLFDDWSNLAVHVAMDNTVVIEDISE